MSDIEPTGAVFRRCALQVNPHHYASTFRGQKTGRDARSYAEAMVAKALDAGVSVLAVTDHNDVSGVEAFRLLVVVGLDRMRSGRHTALREPNRRSSPKSPDN